MDIDTIITLDNNENYLLLMEDTMQKDNYFLAVLLDEKDEPTNTYAAFKEIIKGNEIYCEKVSDLAILSSLYDDYSLQLKEDFENE